MPTIVMDALRIAIANLPKIAKELATANKLKAIEIKAKAGMVAAVDTMKAVDDAINGKARNNGCAV